MVNKTEFKMPCLFQLSKFGAHPLSNDQLRAESHHEQVSPSLQKSLAVVRFPVKITCWMILSF